jgi:hypothetical protein
MRKNHLEKIKNERKIIRAMKEEMLAHCEFIVLHHANLVRLSEFYKARYDEDVARLGVRPLEIEKIRERLLDMEKELRKENKRKTAKK